MSAAGCCSLALVFICFHPQWLACKRLLAARWAACGRGTGLALAAPHGGCQRFFNVHRTAGRAPGRCSPACCSPASATHLGLASIAL